MARKVATLKDQTRTTECMIATALRVQNLTMADVARHLEVSRQMVSAVIRGKRRSRRVELYLCERFHLSRKIWGKTSRKVRAA